MNYSELDLNARINLKGTYEQFLKIAVERFEKELEKKLYKVRSKGARKLTRSRNLYNSFSREFKATSSGMDVLKIQFLMYGRYMDMGVGRGSNVSTAQYRKKVGAKRADTTRIPRRWYSKTKSHEEKRIVEILSSTYGMGFIRLAENLLSQTVTIA